MVSRVIPVDAFDLVIFGGTGDLAKRKILPGLYRRFLAGQMTENSRIIGAARADLTDAAFRTLVGEAIAEFVPKDRQDKKAIADFLDKIAYVSIDATGEGGWAKLQGLMRDNVVRAFYFSVAPSLFGDIAERLHLHGIADAWSRIVVEKPFGRDLDSARALNAVLAKHFTEAQIYRIDHYLGKETVQNLMAVRFANILFEPLWKAEYIDHVQITVAETVSVDGRGAYYDKSGAMRDMVQNHMMQLLCLIAMEPPYHFDPDAVRDEKLKVIRALKPVSPEHIVRGQYNAGKDEGGYIEHSENPASKTESYIALKVNVSNWRWQGVPFYLRTGKRLPTRRTEIVVQFRRVPHSIFAGKGARSEPNRLVIGIQPEENITLSLMAKVPGLDREGLRLREVPLDIRMQDAFAGPTRRIAYERLLLDLIEGDQTLFVRRDEVEAQWDWIDAIRASWAEHDNQPKPYAAGTWGPSAAIALTERDGVHWHD